MKIAGIDPGREGYITVLDTKSTRGWTCKMRYCDDKILDLNVLNMLPSFEICFIENLHGRGGWGAKTNFGLGSYYGQIQLWLKQKAIDVNRVIPKTWINHFGGDKKLSTKKRTLQSYKNLFKHEPIKPRMVKGEEAYNDNLIDSLMLAVYGYETLTKKKPRKWNFQNVTG